MEKGWEIQIRHTHNIHILPDASSASTWSSFSVAPLHYVIFVLVQMYEFPHRRRQHQFNFVMVRLRKKVWEYYDHDVTQSVFSFYRIICFVQEEYIA